jgi:hypothetical protein
VASTTKKNTSGEYNHVEGMVHLSADGVVTRPNGRTDDEQSATTDVAEPMESAPAENEVKADLEGQPEHDSSESDLAAAVERRGEAETTHASAVTAAESARAEVNELERRLRNGDSSVTPTALAKAHDIADRADLYAEGTKSAVESRKAEEVRVYSAFHARRLSDALGLNDVSTDVDAAQAEAVEVITAALNKLHAVADARSVYVKGVLRDAIRTGLTYDSGEFRGRPTEGVPGVRDLPLHVSRIDSRRVLILDGEKVAMPDVAGDVGSALNQAATAAGVTLNVFTSAVPDALLGRDSVLNKPVATLREGGRAAWVVDPILSPEEFAIRAEEEAEAARDRAETAARREAEKVARRGPRGPRPVTPPREPDHGPYGSKDGGYTRPAVSYAH